MRILVVVDMQNDFVDGALGTKEAQAIVPALARRLRQANAVGERVLFTLDTHGEGYADTAEGRALPVRHCIIGTQGHALTEALLPLAQGALMIEKPTFGSFALAEAVVDMAPSPEGEGIQIELCGLCTDICVVTNALILKTRLPEARVLVRAHLCAGVTPEKHQAALEVMRSCQVEVLA